MKNISLYRFIIPLMALAVFLAGPGMSLAQLEDGMVFEAQEADSSDAKPMARLEVLEVRDEPVSNVIEMLAAQSGLNIVLSEQVKGSITIFLKDVNAEDALRIILDTHGLAFHRDNGIYQVLTAEEFKGRFGYSFGQKIQTQIVPLLHSQPEEVLDILEEMKSDSGKIIFNDQTNTFILIDSPDKIELMNDYVKRVDIPIETITVLIENKDAVSLVDQVEDLLTRNKGSVSVNEKTNEITVTDTLLKTTEVQKLLDRLDEAPKQFHIMAKVIQIILNDEHTSGVDWEAIVSDFQSVEFLGLKNAIEAKDRQISLGTVSAEDYQVLLEALVTVGDINEIGDGEWMIKFNERLEVPVNALQVVSLIPEEKQFIDQNGLYEDVKFFVTPRSIEETQLTIHVQPEVFNLAEEDTLVKIADGATIVIGGLFKNVTTITERRIPLLDDIPIIRSVPFEDIPILGFAFRNSKRKERKTEVMVFLSVKAVEED